MDLKMMIFMMLMMKMVTIMMVMMDNEEEDKEYGDDDEKKIWDYVNDNDQKWCVQDHLLALLWKSLLQTSAKSMKLSKLAYAVIGYKTSLLEMKI